jgi:hypothetical protein
VSPFGVLAGRLGGGGGHGCTRGEQRAVYKRK